MGSFLARPSRGWLLPVAKWLHDTLRLPDPYSIAVEQQQTKGSNFMEKLFWENYLNPDVKYLQIAEDRIFGGDGVVSYNSARGVVREWVDAS